MTAGESDQVKRLRMRSWRRGTKEMDMILGPFSDEILGDLTGQELDQYEQLLHENDQDLYQWVSGQVSPPQTHAELIDRIANFAQLPRH